MIARPFTAADSAALVATAKARPDYQAAIADEAAGRIGPGHRAAILRGIYRELLVAGGWCTKAKYNRLYPPESRTAPWLDSILAAVKAGQVLRRQVCDDLYRRAPGAYRQMIHDFGTGWLPEGYRNPDTRKANER